MRIRIHKVLIAASVAMLCACVDTPTKAEQPKSHVDLAYTQFILHAGGSNDTQPYNLSGLQGLPGECGATGVPPKAGGGAILATLATSLLSKMADAIVKELQNLINAEVAKYSSDVVGKPVRVGFYSPKLWFTKPGAADQYSCFIIALNKCDASQVDKDKGVCPNESGAHARVLIVGQFKLTPEALQLRPLFGQVRGFEAMRNAAEKEASIAATLKLDSVWWDGHEAHTAAPMTATALSLRFVPTSGDADDPGINLAVQHRDSTGKYAYADWDSLALLPRPPQSPGSEGTVAITPSVAETNSPPKGLTLIQKVLNDNSGQISSALESALKNLVPPK
jgi:hypothetical protein